MHTTNNYSKTHQNAQHIDEWVNGSGVSEAITLANLVSITAEKANDIIRPKHPIQSDGWIVAGVDWATGKPLGLRYGQFKPDKPHVTDPSKPEKTAKYLTASGVAPDATFLAMPGDKDYWHKVYKNRQPVLFTEGNKKGGAGLTIGVPTISIPGVWNFGKDGELAFDVKDWIEQSDEVYLAFDSDYREKPQCVEAIKRLCKIAATECGKEIKIVTWDSRWKGMDDFIKANGRDAFLERMKNALTIEQWEQQLKKDGTRKGKPTPQNIAKGIAEEYQPTWRYSNGEQTWRFWNGKYWEKKPDSYVKASVKAILDSRNIQYQRSAFIVDVAELMKLDLTAFKWETFDRTEYIAFENGVLEVETGKLLEHSPGYGFTSVLPYEYDTLNPIKSYSSVIDALKTECSTTYRFMSEAMKGNERAIEKLLGIINAVIKFRFHDLQMFVHLSGKPGTGKGTFLRLLQKCVGKNNYKGSSLTGLSKDDEIANIIDKQLVTLSDERKQTSCEMLLKLTGGDDVSYRQIYKEGGSGVFRGAMVIASNTPILTGDTTGIDRRLCPVLFDNPVPDNQRTNEIESLMDDEIAKLIAVSLIIEDARVTELIRGIKDADIPSFKLHSWRLKCEADSVASFFDDSVIVSPHSTGLAGKELFEAYQDYCEENGLKALANNKFPERFTELCRTIGVKVEKTSKANRVTWVGIRLRKDYDEELTYGEQLEEQVKQSEQSKQKTKASEPTVEEHTQPTQPPEQNSVENDDEPEFKVGDEVRRKTNGFYGVIKKKLKNDMYSVEFNNSPTQPMVGGWDLEEWETEKVDPPCPL